MARLRLLDGILDVRIVDFRIAAVGLQIARGLEPPSQLHNCWVTNACAQFDHRQLRPSASRDNVGILLDRRFSCDNVFLRERRITAFRLSLPLLSEGAVTPWLFPIVT